MSDSTSNKDPQKLAKLLKQRQLLQRQLMKLQQEGDALIEQQIQDYGDQAK